MKRDGVFWRKDINAWCIQFVHNGKTYKHKTAARNKKEALDIRAAEQVALQKASALGVTPPTEDSFATKAREYLESYRGRKRKLSPENRVRRAQIFEQHIIPFFNKQLKAITVSDVELYLAEREGEVSASTLSKELGLLKHMLRYCAKKQYIPNSPAADVEGPEVLEKEEALFIPKEKFQAFLDECPEELRPIMQFAVSTGFRRRNLLELTWGNINWENRVVTLPKTKTGLKRFPLNDKAIEILRFMAIGRDIKPGGLVFPIDGPPNSVSTAVRRAAKRAGLPGVHLHSLRHTYASWMVMAGTPLYVVSRLLGHKNLKQTEIYAHLSPGFLREQTDSFSDVFSCINPRDAHGMTEGANLAHPVTSGHVN